MAVIETPAANSTTRLFTTKNWPHGWPSTDRAWRNLISKSHINGANAFIKRVGRRILIDEAAFLAWVELQNARSTRR